MSDASPIQAPSYLQLPPISLEGKDHLTVAIGTLAIASIFALTVAVLAHVEVLVGLNAMTQMAFYAAGGGGALVVFVSSAVLHVFSTPKYVFKVEKEELKKQLQELCRDLSRGSKDVLDELEKCVQEIPLEKLQETTTVKDVLQLIKVMVEEADFYDETCESIDPPLYSRITIVRDTLLNAIDSFLGAFGVADFFKPSDSEFQADFKFQKIMMLVSLFTLMTATLLPMLGVTTGSSIVGGTLLLIAVLSLIWPRVRPALSRLPNGENWTQKYREGKMEPVSGRFPVVKRIAEGIIAGQHVLVYGISGIGKTMTVQELVQAIERGDFPALRGKKIIYYNAARLVEFSEMFSYQNTILEKIEADMGSNKDDYIIILDEGHIAFTDAQHTFREKMKTFMDRIPHLVILTTYKEYMLHIANQPPIDRRLDEKIPVDSTDPKSTEIILNKAVLLRGAECLVAPGALTYLVQQTDATKQPLSALDILSRIFSIVFDPHNRKMEEELAQHEKDYELLISQGVVSSAASRENQDERFKKLKELEDQIAGLKKQCEEEKAKYDRLSKACERLGAIHEAKYAAARAENEAKVLLLREYQEPEQEAYVRELAASLGVKVEINKNLIDEVIKAEKEKAAERQKLVEADAKQKRTQDFLANKPRKRSASETSTK